MELVLRGVPRRHSRAINRSGELSELPRSDPHATASLCGSVVIYQPMPGFTWRLATGAEKSSQTISPLRTSVTNIRTS